MTENERCSVCYSSDIEHVHVNTHYDESIGQMVTDDGVIWTSCTDWNRCRQCGNIQ